MTLPRTDFVPCGQWKRCQCGGEVHAFLLWLDKKKDWTRVWYCATCCHIFKGANFPE